LLTGARSKSRASGLYHHLTTRRRVSTTSDIRHACSQHRNAVTSMHTCMYVYVLVTVIILGLGAACMSGWGRLACIGNRVRYETRQLAHKYIEEGFLNTFPSVSVRTAAYLTWLSLLYAFISCGQVYLDSPFKPRASHATSGLAK